MTGDYLLAARMALILHERMTQDLTNSIDCITYCHFSCPVRALKFCSTPWRMI